MSLSRTIPLKRDPDKGLKAGKPLQRRAWLRQSSGKRPVSGPHRQNRPQRRDTIPPKVRKAAHARDQHWCLFHGGYFPDGGIHLHHRRLKQAGGTSAEHGDCCCAIVSVCWECHAHIHDTASGRLEAERRGFIIPAATAEPWRFPVLVYAEYGGDEDPQWPTCEGGRDGWIFAEPNEVAA